MDHFVEHCPVHKLNKLYAYLRFAAHITNSHATGNNDLIQKNVKMFIPFYSLQYICKMVSSDGKGC